MIDLEVLSRDELWSLAKTWRRQALRGDKTAYGPAHVFEAAYRRRFGRNAPSRAPQEPDSPAAPAPRKRWHLW